MNRAAEALKSTRRDRATDDNRSVTVATLPHQLPAWGVYDRGAGVPHLFGDAARLAAQDGTAPRPAIDLRAVSLAGRMARRGTARARCGAPGARAGLCWLDLEHRISL